MKLGSSSSSSSSSPWSSLTAFSNQGHGEQPNLRHNHHPMDPPLPANDMITDMEHRVVPPSPQHLQPFGNNNHKVHHRSVHAFYYPWYCNPTIDGQYFHWNHPYLPHWNPETARKWPQGRHDPTREDLGATYYPQLGAYSSRDPTVLAQHMQWMNEAAHIDVAVVSWLPKKYHDDNGQNIAQALGPILNAAHNTTAAGGTSTIRIAIHMEPYEGRTVDMVRKDIQELLDEHGTHPALYRIPRPSMEKDPAPAAAAALLPVLYFYDSYHMDAKDWKELFAEPAKTKLRGKNAAAISSQSIRGSPYDVVALALIVDKQHWKSFVEMGDFDGGYTYFAAEQFSWGSTKTHWKWLQEQATVQHKLFVPSVGPGYDDTTVRPWNSATTRSRTQGTYYDDHWHAAMDSGADIISITSFNEWHEGTQIEPAIEKVSGTGRKYADYGAEGGPMAYLERTKMWAHKFAAS